jgi:hypothetical protein
MLSDIRAQLRRQARMLSRLAMAIPGSPVERLASYRTDPARLMVDAGYDPDEWQRDLLRSPAARVLMLTCRQAGKSTTAGFLALREALAKPGNTVLVVCPSQRQSGASRNDPADRRCRSFGVYVHVEPEPLHGYSASRLDRSRLRRRSQMTPERDWDVSRFAQPAR